MSDGKRRQAYQVQDLPLLDKVVEATHHLFDTCFKVPPVDVKEVNIVGAELLERRSDGDLHGLDAVACVQGLLLDTRVATLEVGRVLRSDEELITDAALLCPFANE